MDKSPEQLNIDNLPNEDPRYYTIEQYGTGSISHATTQMYSGTHASFGLPSTTALFLNLSHKAWFQGKEMLDADLFINTDQGLQSEDHAPLFNLFELRISNIVFAFSALEAFANQSVPENYQFNRLRSDGRCEEVYNRNQIERYLNLDTKLDKVLPTIFSVASPKGGPLWNRYTDLKALRDRIIHIKSQDTKSGGPELDTLWGKLLNTRTHNFAVDAHMMIGYYLQDKHKPRWFRLFPYQ